MIKSLSVKDFFENFSSYTLIDVREPAEYNEASIKGSYLIPLSQISSSTIPQTDKPIVIHCRSGKRSAAAIEKLLKDSPDLPLFNLEGGILAWIENNYPVQKSLSSCVKMSLDRQVQIIIGLITLIGVLLGHFITQSFLLINLFVACGLIFAGISGFCSLSFLLAKMPWNK